MWQLSVDMNQSKESEGSQRGEQENLVNKSEANARILGGLDAEFDASNDLTLKTCGSSSVFKKG